MSIDRTTLCSTKRTPNNGSFRIKKKVQSSFWILCQFLCAFSGGSCRNIFTGSSLHDPPDIFKTFHPRKIEEPIKTSWIDPILHQGFWSLSFSGPTLTWGCYEAVTLTEHQKFRVMDVALLGDENPNFLTWKNRGMGLTPYFWHLCPMFIDGYIMLYHLYPYKIPVKSRSRSYYPSNPPRGITSKLSQVESSSTESWRQVTSPNRKRPLWGHSGGLVKIPKSWKPKHDLNGDFTNDEWIFFGILGWIEWIEPTIWCSEGFLSL